MSDWTQVFRGKASVFALDEHTKQWDERGTSGVVTMLEAQSSYMNSAPQIRLKWERPTDLNSQPRWWQLSASKLKPKGERAIVLKALALSHSPKQQEILAVRFSLQSAAVQFADHYYTVFPATATSKMDAHRLFKPNEPASAKRRSVALPSSVLEHEDRDIHTFEPNSKSSAQPQMRPLPEQAQHHHGHGNGHASPPPQPPKRARRVPPKPDRRRDYVQNGQIVDGSFPRGPPPSQAQSRPRGPVMAHGSPPSWLKAKDAYEVKNEPIALEYGDAPNSEPPKWKCAVCTYENSDSVSKCAMCGLPQNSKDAESSEDEMMRDKPQSGKAELEKWQCHACTFSNFAWNERCEVCHAKRQNGAAAQPIHKPKPFSPINRGVGGRGGAMVWDDPSSPRLPWNPIPAARPDQNGQNQGQFRFASRNQQPWSCPICTLQNPAMNPRCDACNTARNLAIAGPMSNQPQPPMGQYPYSPKPLPIGGGFQGAWDKMMTAGWAVSGNPYNINLHEQFGGADAALGGGGGGQRISGLGLELGMVGGGDNGYFESTVADFQRAASDIACYNKVPSSVFSTLRSVAKKLLKDDARYRTLDTTNPKVMERLIGYEGVLDFLQLLGFESDAMGMKLICQEAPSAQVVQNAITVLNSYQQRFRMTDNGMGLAMGMNMGMNMGAPLGQHGQVSMSSVYGGGGNYNNYDPNANANARYGDNGHEPFGNAVSPGGQWDEPEADAKDKNKNDILTLEQIVIWSTHESMQDSETMETLIMTHKMFTDSLTLLKQLHKRFFVPIPPSLLQTDDKKAIREFQSGVQKRIQLKVIKALRDWMKQYWSEDFDNDQEVLGFLDEWLKELSVYNQLDIHNVGCEWISKWFNVVHKEKQRLQALDWEQYRQDALDVMKIHNLVEVKVPPAFNYDKATPEDVADQITLLNYTLFSRIQRRECLHQRWKDGSNKAAAPNILSLIEQFNNFSIFVQVMVLRERTLKKRATAMRRIIKMGEHFRATRNYNSLCSVFSALKSAPIHRLKLAWSRVPDKNRQQFEEWSLIFCRDFNHRNLRTLLRKAGGNPCIPHIGVFLQDLVFIDEGNKRKMEEANFGKIEMLNFNKCVRIADRIKNLQLFQQNNYDAKMKADLVMQKVLLQEFEKLKDVTEDQIWDMSTTIKKQDAREDKKGLFGGGKGGVKGHYQIPPAAVAVVE